MLGSTRTPAFSQSETIRHLAGIADTIGSILGVVSLLNEASQADALALSADLADDLARALTALDGEAQ